MIKSAPKMGRKGNKQEKTPLLGNNGNNGNNAIDKNDNVYSAVDMEMFFLVSSSCPVSLVTSCVWLIHTEVNLRDYNWGVSSHIRVIPILDLGKFVKLKHFSHLTSAFALASNFKNGFYGNKWWCSYLTFAFHEKRKRRR